MSLILLDGADCVLALSVGLSHVEGDRIPSECTCECRPTLEHGKMKMDLLAKMHPARKENELIRKVFQACSEFGHNSQTN